MGSSSTKASHQHRALQLQGWHCWERPEQAHFLCESQVAFLGVGICSHGAIFARL
jgi:hypothetical protein